MAEEMTLEKFLEHTSGKVYPNALTEEEKVEFKRRQDAFIYKSCTSKKQLTKGEAQELVLRMKFRSYFCRFCKHHHVAKTEYTKQPKPDRRRRSQLRERKRKGR